SRVAGMPEDMVLETFSNSLGDSSFDGDSSRTYSGNAEPMRLRLLGHPECGQNELISPVDSRDLTVCQTTRTVRAQILLSRRLFKLKRLGRSLVDDRTAPAHEPTA
ncbi:MAG: hypothetical protein ACK58L_16020, partial [Planctomycetota bacterium]